MLNYQRVLGSGLREVPPPAMEIWSLSNSDKRKRLPDCLKTGEPVRIRLENWKTHHIFAFFWKKTRTASAVSAGFG